MSFIFRSCPTSLFVLVTILIYSASSSILPVNDDARRCSAVPELDRFDCHPGGRNLPDGARQAVCEYLGCCWQNVTALSDGKFGPPPCFYGKDFTGLHLKTVNNSENVDVYGLQLDQATILPYPHVFRSPELEVCYETSTTLRLKLSAPASPYGPQWIPPVPKRPQRNERAQNSQIVFRTSNTANDNQPFAFQVVRNDTGDEEEVLFDTNVNAPLIFTEQYMEFHTKLPMPLVYGLGEHFLPFQRYGNWNHVGFWGYDNVMMDEKRPAYGTQPFFMSFDKKGRAFGVLFFNSNAMEVLMRPGNQLTWRSIGGIIDLYFFAGPTPDDVVRQLTDLIGKPHLPPYWSMGYAISRWGFEGVEGMRQKMQRNLDIGIPIDCQSNGHDYMNNSLDFTVGKDFKDLGKVAGVALGLAAIFFKITMFVHDVPPPPFRVPHTGNSWSAIIAYVEELHSAGRHWYPLIDPQISTTEPAGTYPPYDMGLDQNVFVRTKNGSVFIGILWTGTREAWIDFTHPNASSYWTQMFQMFRDNYVHFDGAWIDMNEPTAFGNGSVDGCDATDVQDNPPYMVDLNGVGIYSRTLCASAKHNMSTHYNMHNLYGHTQAMATRDVMLKTVVPPSGGGPVVQSRPFVLTRSSFLGSGHYTASWSGDYFSTWEAMKRSISHMMNFNMFGMPFVGSDICGFQADTNEELCIRWHQLGAFYPLSRNHNNVGNIDQDPAAWSPPAQAAIRTALQTRYALMPYLYTLMVDSHVNGSAVARALFYNFAVEDDTPQVYNVDDQFMLGEALMINPVLAANATQRVVYFPKARWFDYFSGEEIIPSASEGGVNKIMDVALNQMSVQQRGGTIIPLQYGNLTLAASRLNPFYLQVALDENGTASGRLMWDDGITHGTYPIRDETNGTGAYDHILFYANRTMIKAGAIVSGYDPKDAGLPPMSVDAVKVLGLDRGNKNITTVQINGRELPADQYRFDAKLGILVVERIVNLLLVGGNDFFIEWVFSS